MTSENDYVMKLKDRPEVSSKPKPLTFPPIGKFHNQNGVFTR